MKLKRILLIMVILVFAIPTKSLASEEIIESAEEMLDISSFISEAQKYTEDVFNDVNLDKPTKRIVETKDKPGKYHVILERTTKKYNSKP